MPYPTATPEQIESFCVRGFLVVEDAVDPDDFDRLAELCDEIIDRKEELAADWSWEKGKALEEREFRLVQASPSKIWPDLMDAPFRKWAIAFGTALLGKDVEFWYDQFLGKPPEKGAVTYWHQDEAYWGRTFDDNALTCWMPLHDVDTTNGCMQFIPGEHAKPILEHRPPENIQSDLLYCEVEESRAVACPIRRGSVTFHHGRTPHMAGPNTSDGWRKILTQHLKKDGLSADHADRDPYPWKVTVDQKTGMRIQRG